MLTLKKSATLALAFLCATPSFAQETADDPAQDLDLGTPVNEAPSEPQPGQSYVAAVFDDWSLRCLKQEEGPDPCQLYQLLVDQDGNAVAEMSMFALPPGGRAAAGATIVAPLETLLTEQLTITVDGGEARTYAFTFCNVGGCVARVGFTQAEVDQFKLGNNAVVRLVPAGAPEEEVRLDVSLAGFTAALEATTGN